MHRIEGEYAVKCGSCHATHSLGPATVRDGHPWRLLPLPQGWRRIQTDETIPDFQGVIDCCPECCARAMADRDTYCNWYPVDDGEWPQEIPAPSKG